MGSSAILALEDGRCFKGQSIGVSGTQVGEAVFNTAMTGYQEVLTDPSYCQQIVTLTVPHVGNVGTNDHDAESGSVFASGLVIRDDTMLTSNWRSSESFSDYLQRLKVVAISGVDTRALTRHLRTRGALKACISTELSEAEAVARAQQFPGLRGMALAETVSAKAQYSWNEPSFGVTPRSMEETRHIVVLDYGVKYSILRQLVDQGCRVTVLPATATADEVIAQDPDGVLLSNGPGDPEPCKHQINTVKTLLASGLPMLGICLGHQLMALALGAKTLKMKFGQHGTNQPVKDIELNRVMITSQNHGFAVDPNTLPDSVSPRYISLFDGSLQGFIGKRAPWIGFQGHPEAGPGPTDAHVIFETFIQVIEQERSKIYA